MGLGRYELEGERKGGRDGGKGGGEGGREGLMASPFGGPWQVRIISYREGGREGRGEGERGMVTHQRALKGKGHREGGREGGRKEW